MSHLPNCMIPVIEITSLKTDYYSSTEWGHNDETLKYCVLNATFKISRATEETDILWQWAYNKSKEYARVIVTDDPNKEEEWYLNRLDLPLSDNQRWAPYPGMQVKWTSQDPSWKYIEKFDTFWFRDRVSKSIVTESIIQELRSFYMTGEVVSVYRSTKERTVLKHLETLANYRD